MNDDLSNDPTVTVFDAAHADKITASPAVAAVKPLAAKLDDEPAGDLADKLARAIMSVGDGPQPCTRIQFKGGSYPDSETDQGGFCETALAKYLRETLAGLDGIQQDRAALSQSATTQEEQHA